MYIGGCSLKQHYINILENKDNYLFEYNGENTMLHVSIKQALVSEDWDYVTIQQASNYSFDFDSFVPYIDHMKEYIKKYSPKSKILLHKTWAYPDNVEYIKRFGYQTTEDMFHDVNLAYKKAVDTVGVDGIIPSGDAMLEAYKSNKEIVYRDNIHASLGFGRYLLGIIWYFTIFGVKCDFRHITEFDENVTRDDLALAVNIARKVIN